MAVTEDKKFSGLDLVATPAPSDEFGCNQGGDSFKQTRLQLHTIQVGESFNSVPTAPQILKAGGVEGLRLTNVSGSILQTPEANVGLTADVGSSQGDGVIISSYNVYSVVATAGDAATLPAVFVVDTLIYVKNDGAESMDIFPALGDNAGAGSNIAIAVGSGESAVFIATSANATWTQLISGGTGDVIKVGTPVDDQIGVWTGDGTIEGDPNFTWDGFTLTAAGRALLADGSAGAPAYGFSGETNLGMFRLAEDFLGFSVNGITRTLIDTSGVTGNIGNSGKIVNTGATATSPSILAANGDVNTGLGWGGIDILTLVAGGIAGLRLTELNSSVIQAPDATLGITAFATGGQSSAVQLNTSYNVLGIVASAGDSVKLPPVFTANSLVYVKNDGANAADIFPATGDDLGAGTNVAVSVPSGESKVFIATVTDSTWTELLPSAAAGGDVFKVGTPVNNQIGVWTGDGTIEGDSSFTWDGSQLKLPAENDAVTPTLAIGGVGDGFYQNSPAIISVATSGVRRWAFTGTSFGAVSGSGPEFKNEVPSATNPTVLADQGDSNTGIGHAADDQLSLIVGGLEAVNISEVGNNLQLIVPLQDNAAAPSIAFGDGDTGFYQNINDVINVAHAGVRRWVFQTGTFGAASGSGPALQNEVPSGTNPTINADSGDSDTGLGHQADDILVEACVAISEGNRGGRCIIL